MSLYLRHHSHTTITSCGAMLNVEDDIPGLVSSFVFSCAGVDCSIGVKVWTGWVVAVRVNSGNSPGSSARVAPGLDGVDE